MAKTKTKRSTKTAEYPVLGELLPVVERVIGKTLDTVVSNAIDGEILKSVFGEEPDLQEIENRLKNIRPSGTSKISVGDLLKNTEALLSKIKNSL